MGGVFAQVHDRHDRTVVRRQYRRSSPARSVVRLGPFALAAVVGTTAFVSIAAPAAEIRLAVAPKISLPPNLPVYSEDTLNFYGTNIALLTSTFLRARAEAQ